MPLAWNEIRHRAIKFANEWSSAASESADKQTFWNEFFDAFGSLFQDVMLPQERRQLGAHYTAEKNIMKVVRSLFLDDLCAELEAIKTDKSTRRAARIEEFHDKLSKLTFFDPACGCGNFLVITYRELRALELGVL